jgi:uncharacterized protein DUF998
VPRLAIGTAAVFALTVIVLHFVRTDVDPMARGVSRYAVGKYGSIVNVVFLCLAVALVATGIGFRATIPPAGQAGVYLLWLGAGGIALSALFPLRAGDSEAIENLPHQVGGMIFFPAVAAGAVLLSRAAARDTTPAWVIVAAVTVFFLSIGVPALGLTPVRGLLQRVCFAAIVTWLVVANADVPRETQRRQSASSTP